MHPKGSCVEVYDTHCKTLRNSKFYVMAFSGSGALGERLELGKRGTAVMKWWQLYQKRETPPSDHVTASIT